MQERLNFFIAGSDAMKTMSATEQYLSQNGLDDQLAELVRLRTSLINGCAFCIDKHTQIARKRGEDDRKLATLSVWRETPFFSEKERAALEWTEALTLINQNHVSDETWEQMKANFSEREIVDLTLLVTTTNAWNRFAIAFGKIPR